MLYVNYTSKIAVTNEIQFLNKKVLHMKKTLLLLAILTCVSYASLSQTTYYFKGAAGTAIGGETDWITATNWTTNSDGSADASGGRTSPSSTDILIIDGDILNAINTSKIVYLKMSKDICGSLTIKDSAIVYFSSFSGGNLDVVAASGINIGAFSNGVLNAVTGGTNFTTALKVGDYVSTNGTTGSSGSLGQVLSIVDDANITCSGDYAFNNVSNVALYRVPTLSINSAFTLEAGSTMHMSTHVNTSGVTQNLFCLKLEATASGSISGSVFWNRNSSQVRLVAVTPGSLVFQSGSNCTFQANPVANGMGSSTAGPFFGSALGTGTVGTTFAFNTTAPPITFAKGATFTFASPNVRLYTPFGRGVAASGLILTPAVSFQTGSNYVLSASNYNTAMPYFFSNSVAVYGNLSLVSAIPTNLSARYIDTLRISSASTTLGTGTIHLYGSLLNNHATNNIASGGSIFFSGTVNQSIGGSGTGSFTFTNLYNRNTTGLTLAKNISVSATLMNNGLLDVGTFKVDGGATGGFINNGTTNRTYSQPDGSNEVSGGVKTTANSNAFLIRGINTSLVPLGSTITSSSHPTIFPAGTYVASYSTGGNFTASNPATLTADSASTPVLSLTFTNTAGTFVTPSTSGMDSSLLNMASTTLNTGANYIFNAATTTPFSSAAASTISAGNVTVTGATTLNKHILNVSGNLTLGAGNLSVNTGDTIIIKAGNSVTGSASAFIDTKVDVATGAKAVLGIEGFNTTRTFPVGTNGNYLPVTITPDTLSNFYVTAFNNATVDGTPNGTALSASQKDTSVNAIYLVNRTSPTSGRTYTLSLGYPSALKGTTFATYTTQIGISNYNGSSWSASHGFGDNTSNTATDTVSTTGAFYVTRNATPITILPVKIGALSASLVGANAVKVSWNVYDEVNIDQYVVEASSNGVTFVTVGAVKATGSTTYSLVDNSASGSVVYYRVKSVDKGTGAVSYSSVVSIALNAAKVASVNVYPNPVVGSELHLQTTNFKAGKLYVMLYNNQGKQIAQQAIAYNGGAMAQTLVLSNAVNAGTYQLVVTDGTSSINKTIFVVR
jgi:hypothetical protein